MKHAIQCHFIFYPQSQLSRASKGLVRYPDRKCLWLNDIKRELETSSLSTPHFPIIITPNHTYTHLHMHTWTTQIPPSFPSHSRFWMGTGLTSPQNVIKVRISGQVVQREWQMCWEYGTPLQGSSKQKVWVATYLLLSRDRPIQGCGQDWVSWWVKNSKFVNTITFSVSWLSV